MSGQSTPATARALWFTGPSRAELRTETLRPVGSAEVAVRALHSLVSAGSELNMYRGEGNLPTLLIPTAEGRLPFPVKFAYQVVGVIEEAGTESGFNVGDKVFAVHPHQERFTLAATPRLVHRLPSDYPPVRAAFTGMLCVGLRVLLSVPVHPGDVVAVSGLGVIGTLTAYLARLSAGKLILIDPLTSRRERAQWIGADAVVPPEEAVATIFQLSRGRGADIFVETSGAPQALQTALGSTGTLGTIAVAAWYGTRPVSLAMSPEFHLKSQRIVSIWVGQVTDDSSARWDTARLRDTALDYLARLNIEKLISHRVAFSHAPDAYRLLDEQPAAALGVLLDYGT